MPKKQYQDKRFLIIDNLKQPRDTLKQFSLKLGANVVDAVYRSVEIMAKCEEIKYDVILLGYDLGEGNKNGQQILEELRKKTLITRRCIVIMITAEVTQSMVLAALEHKPNDYLAKPYSLKQLEQRIERAINKVDTMDAIYFAMDNNNHAKVIRLCDAQIDINSRYKHECLGIKSRQYFELNDYDKAKAIYLTYKDSPNCHWAKIGLGKIALKSKKLAEARKLFQEVIKENPMYLTAYDLLIDSYLDNNQQDRAEQLLEKVVTLSPRSITRLRKYADLCFRNEQYEKATEAYFKTHDLAKHSIHKKPNNTFDLTRSFLKYQEQLPDSQTRKLRKRIMSELSEISREFSDYEVKIQVGLFNAHLHFILEELLEGQSALERSERLIERKIEEISVSGLDDIADLLTSLNRQEKASQLRRRADELKIANKELLNGYSQASINNLTDDEKNQAQAALEIAINYYRTNKYRQAYEKLNSALLVYPKHIGIKLNLLQVILVGYEKNSVTDKELQQAEVIIEELNKLLARDLDKKRFEKLKGKYESLVL